MWRHLWTTLLTFSDVCKPFVPKERSGANFIKVLWAAFICADLKNAKNKDKFYVFFALLGSGRVKAVHKMLMKLTPGQAFDRFPFSMDTWTNPGSVRSPRHMGNIAWNDQNIRCVEIDHLATLLNEFLVLMQSFPLFKHFLYLYDIFFNLWPTFSFCWSYIN